MTRPVAAGLFALILLLQSIAALGVSHAYHGPAGVEAGIASSSIDGPCTADDLSGEPGRHESDGRPLCCVFCPTSAFGGMPIYVMAGAGVAAIPLSNAPVSFSALSYDIPHKPPTGWATSWSSQAPPAFS